MESWYALHVRPQSEALVESALIGRSLEAFWPSYVPTDHRPRGSKPRPLIRKSLFPGYVFSRLDYSTGGLNTLMIPQIVRILGPNGQPLSIPDREVESVRIMAGSPVIASPHPFLAEGDTVLVKRGPMAGVEGVVVYLGDKARKARVIVNVNFLGRSCSAEVDLDMIEPVKKAA